MSRTVSASDVRKKQAQQDAIASAELTDTEMALINSAEIPAEQRYSLDKS